MSTCTVKSPSQAAAGSLLARGRALGKALLVTGCVPQGARAAPELQGLSLLGAPLPRAAHARAGSPRPAAQCGGARARPALRPALPCPDLPCPARAPATCAGVGECAWAVRTPLVARPRLCRRGPRRRVSALAAAAQA